MPQKIQPSMFVINLQRHFILNIEIKQRILILRFLGEHHWHHQHLICIFCILSGPLELILHFAFVWLELLPGAIFFAWLQFAVCEQQVLWALTVVEGLAFTKRRAFWFATQKDICCFKSRHKIFAWLCSRSQHDRWLADRVTGFLVDGVYDRTGDLGFVSGAICLLG